MSKRQATRIHPEQDSEVPPAGTGKQKLRFTVAKLETPIPPGGFIYAGCICNSIFQVIRKSAVEVP